LSQAISELLGVTRSDQVSHNFTCSLT